jgi:molybdate transport system ATP-binding protein
MTIEVAIGHNFGGFSLDVGFATAEPGVTALFGPSGSGKTSTINAIAGLLRPRFGRVTINGTTLLDTERGICLRPRHRRVGYVFQDARLFPHLSVRANLLFGWRRAGRPFDARAIHHLVDVLGIGGLLDRRPGALSGGERQRVALGRALLAKPAVLLLDEPLAALDHARKAEIMPYLERLRDEARVPMIYVSHTVDEVARLADQMIILNDGRVAAEGTVFDVMARLDLFPLTGRFEGGAVLMATVREHDRRDALTELEFAGGRLVVPLLDRPIGERLRVRVRARDVMIAVAEPHGVSANTILRGTITEIRADPGAYADVQLACGVDKLVARITRRSVERLGLRPGRPVFAVIKAVTVDRHTLSGAVAH